MISLVIPAFNEELRIQSCLKKALSVADEVIVVIDGSDRTWERVADIAYLDPRVKLLEFGHRLGKGGAFAAGAKIARGSTIFLVDADFPVPPNYVKLFADLLQDFDCVVGSRYSAKSTVIGQPLTRRILSLGYRRLSNLLFNLDLEDYQCGFKAFRKRSLKKVLSELQCVGFTFDVELLIRLAKAGCKIAQCPVPWTYGRGSKVSGRQVIGMFLELLEIKHNI